MKALPASACSRGSLPFVDATWRIRRADQQKQLLLLITIVQLLCAEQTSPDKHPLRLLHLQFLVVQPGSAAVVDPVQPQPGLLTQGRSKAGRQLVAVMPPERVEASGVMQIRDQRVVGAHVRVWKNLVGNKSGQRCAWNGGWQPSLLGMTEESSAVCLSVGSRLDQVKAKAPTDCCDAYKAVWILLRRPSWPRAFASSHACQRWTGVGIEQIERLDTHIRKSA